MTKAFGLMLSAVQSRRRALASAMAQLPINLLGMAGGPLGLNAAAMDFMGENSHGNYGDFPMDFRDGKWRFNHKTWGENGMSNQLNLIWGKQPVIGDVM